MANPLLQKIQLPNSSEFLKNVLLWQAAIVVIILGIIFSKVSLENGFPLHRRGVVFGSDFMNMWHYGKAALSDAPGLWYNNETYNAHLQAHIEDYPTQYWSYPPHVMLLAAPFGFMGYKTALASFCLLSAVCYHLATRDIFNTRMLKLSLWIMPTIALTLVAGQLSVLLAAAFIVIFRTLDSRPWAAGLLIALMTVKPQIGFIFPIFLLATGRYKVFGWASLFSVLFIGTSIAVYGLSLWETFLTNRVGEQMELLLHIHPMTRGWMPSVAVNAGIAGLGPKAMAIVHIIAALAAIGFMVWGVRKTKDKFLQYALFLAVSFVATPYLMIYDTVILGWAALILVMFYGTARLDRFFYRAFILMIPISTLLSLLHIPGSALILLAMVVWVGRYVVQDSRPIEVLPHLSLSKFRNQK